MGIYLLLALLGLAIWLFVGCAAQTPLGGRYEFDPDPKQIEAFSRGAAEGAVKGMRFGL